jgi:hypothetical protein
MDARAEPRTLEDDLNDLLHPRDEADLPTPGPHDPRFAALIAWARSQPRCELLDALKDVLARDAVAQQTLAMGVLRKLGVECDGRDFGRNFRWVVTEPVGGEHEIDPSIKAPVDPVTR